MALNLLILLNEIHKGLLHVRRYKLNLLAQLAMFSLLFIGIGFLMGGGHMDVSRLPSMLIGFVMWYYAFMVIVNMSSSLAMEAQTGTLEQTYMSPAPPELILLGRVLATFASATVLVLIMVGGLMLQLRIPLSISWRALPIFALTLVGVFGFGFIIGGATLAFKRVETFANLIQNMLLFLNGTLLPIDRFPDWMAAVARTLPTTEGIVLLRAVTFEGRDLKVFWLSGSLIWLAVHSFLYLIAGWLIFKWCERYSKQHGTLGHY